jgi:hypothetical protein
MLKISCIRLKKFEKTKIKNLEFKKKNTKTKTKI